jgi:hypothetical protein
LLETQEFQDGQIDSWVKAEAALVWTESRVELDSVATVHLDLALVVLPGNTELDNTLWDGGNLESFLVFGVLLEEG